MPETLPAQSDSRSQPTRDGPAHGSIWALLKPIWARLAVVVVLEVTAALLWLVPFVAVYELAVQAMSAKPAGVWDVAAVAVASVVLRLICQAVASTVAHRADLALQLDLRSRMARHLGKVPLGWFTERNSGRVKGALSDDIDDMHYLVAHALPDFAAGAVTPVAALVYLATVDWRMTLVTLITLPFFLGGFAVMARVGGRQMPRVSAAMRRLNAAIVEFAQGIAVVKTFGYGRRGHRRFIDAADDYADTFGDAMAPLIRLQVITSALVSPVLMLSVVLTGGAVFIGNDWLPPVDLIPFVALALALTTPITALGLNSASFKAAGAAAQRVAAVLDTPPMPEPARPERPQGHRVEFDGVSFAYEPDRPVLHRVSATLEPGTVTAVVGPSGAGKSTLAALVPRFFDVSEGEVRIGGVDVREMAIEDVYSTVGFVFQDVQLLRASVADNLRIAKPSATPAEIAAAARAAQIHDRILALPRGYDSIIGQDAHLSGGEAQRLSVARVLLADAPVLILDEATAYADPESEAAIQEALSRLVANRTLLVIAHRLNTVVDADQILVLEQGRLVGRGTHHTLLRADGLYRRMWQANEERELDQAVEVEA